MTAPEKPSIVGLRIALAQLASIGGAGCYEQWRQQEGALQVAIDELAALRDQVAACTKPISERPGNDLKAYLYDLVMLANVHHRDSYSNEAEKQISAAIDELRVLRTWRAAAEPLLHALVDSHVVDDDTVGWVCLYCRNEASMTSQTHTADCPVTQARGLLGVSESKGAA